MQLSLQLSRLDKVICYLTFCNNKFICLIYISIFVISEVFEDSSLTVVVFFHLRRVCSVNFEPPTELKVKGQMF